MAWRDDISEVIELHNLTPSLQYWMKVLDYFDKHKDNLSLSDIEYLAYESERCRKYWNKDREFTQLITKNGKFYEQQMVKKGLGIEKEEVFPNIHRHIQKLLEEQLEKVQHLEVA